MKVTLEQRSGLAEIVRRTGGFEDAEIEISSALYSVHYSGRHILDVGANIGLHSLAWSKLAPVVSLEPSPETFALLEANVAANGLQDRIRTVCAAAGDTVGKVEFFVAKDSALSSLKDTKRLPIVDRIVVPCTTLDALAEQLPPIGLLKIDVEGLEHSVIAGAGKLLKRDRPVLFVEIYAGTDSNPDPEGTIEDICGYGYTPFVYASDVGLVPYETHRDDRYNYFFIPSQAA